MMLHATVKTPGSNPESLNHRFNPKLETLNHQTPSKPCLNPKRRNLNVGRHGFATCAEFLAYAVRKRPASSARFKATGLGFYNPQGPNTYSYTRPHTSLRDCYPKRLLLLGSLVRDAISVPHYPLNLPPSWASATFATTQS